MHGDELQFDVSREPRVHRRPRRPGEVNLEKALRADDRLGGHIVTGHVDGVGEVLKFEAIEESHELVIRAPREIAGYIARKGSITVDGVSLTVNRVDGTDFSINLIPIPSRSRRSSVCSLAPGSISRSTSSPATSSACRRGARQVAERRPARETAPPGREQARPRLEVGTESRIGPRPWRDWRATGPVSVAALD